MPKDNEVDEKVMPVAWIVTNGGESCEPWLEYEQSEVDALPAVCIAEPIYSAATVAELRAKADAAERRVGELENPGQQDDYLDALDALWRIQGNDGPIYKMFLAFVNRVIPLTGADPT